MAGSGFKPTVSLVMEEGGARLTDSASGRTVVLTELEGRVLDLYSGQSADRLAGQAQHAGIGLWPDQVRALLERAEANGFLVAPLEVELRTGPALLPTDVVPRFRSDLSLTKAPGSRAVVQVVDPVTQQAFSLFDFEASIARMLNGTRTVGEVIDLASKIGIPVTPDSLDRFLRHLESFGFLDTTGAPAADVAWDRRNDWGPEVRELFQAALRLLRGGQPQAALDYLDAILQTSPDLPEVLDLRARAEAAIASGGEDQLSFDELHARPAPAPPPLPDEEAAEPRRPQPPPAVARVEGMGLLPPPRSSGPVPKIASLPPRSTLQFGRGVPGLGLFDDPPTSPAGGPFLTPRPPPAPSPPRKTPPPPPPPPPRVIFGSAPLGASARPPSPSGPKPRPARLEVPPRASPPPHGAEPLADPLTGGLPGKPSLSGRNLPTIEAELAQRPPPAAQEPSVQVDSLAFVPNGSSVEVDPAWGPHGDGFSASEADAPAGLAPDLRVTAPGDQLAAELLRDQSFGAPQREALATDPAQAEPPSAEPLPPAAPAFELPPPEAGAPPRGRARGLVALTAAVVLAAGAMAIPVPRVVDAACALSPVVVAEPKVEADGEVHEIEVRSGDVVAAGTVLARITVVEPPAAQALLEKEKAARAKADRLKAAAKTSQKARKAAALLARAEKELAKAKAGLAKYEGKRASAAQAKAKKAADAKQRARDRALATFDQEHATARRAAFEAEALAAAAERAKLLEASPGQQITAPAAGRFEAPAKHAIGLGIKAGERYGQILDPGMWKVTAHELPAATEPSTAQLLLESGRIIDVTNASLVGDGPLRTLEGNALLTDDAAAAGKPLLRVGAGRRPLALVLWSQLRRLR